MSEIKPRGVSLVDLERHMCRFPLTKDMPHRFCGAQRKDEDTSYCPQHAALCTAGKPKLPQLKPFRVAA